MIVEYNKKHKQTYKQKKIVTKFDMPEAIRVGIVYTLMINTTLLAFAIAYLVMQSGHYIWLLGITMLLAPLTIAAIGILLFRYIIDNRKNLCFCCCHSIRKSFISNIGGIDDDYTGYQSPKPIEELSLPRSKNVNSKNEIDEAKNDNINNNIDNNDENNNNNENNSNSSNNENNNDNIVEYSNSFE